jgi:hypothetical protein
VGDSEAHRILGYYVRAGGMRTEGGEMGWGEGPLFGR